MCTRAVRNQSSCGSLVYHVELGLVFMWWPRCAVQAGIGVLQVWFCFTIRFHVDGGIA